MGKFLSYKNNLSKLQKIYYGNMHKLITLRADGIKSYQLYFLIQLFSITALYIIMEGIFVRDFFWYPDLTETSQEGGEMAYFACSWDTPNFLYTMGVCALGITALSNWQTIFLALFLNTLRDLIIVNIALDAFEKNKKKALVYVLVLVLTLNPYLGYNHLRLTTETFACLGILHIFVAAYYRQPLSLKFLAIASLLTAIRNPLAIPYIVYIFFATGPFLQRAFEIKGMVFIGCIVGLILSFGGIEYFNLVSPALSYGPYSFFEIKILLNDLPIYVSSLLSFIILIPLHLFLLLSARELIVGYGFITIFENGMSAAIISILFIFIMVVMNSISSYGTIKYFANKNWLVLSIFAYVIPSFLIVAHLRYLYPLMPILSLGFVLWINETGKANKIINRYF
jgi:hypothetical protein